MLSRRHNFPLKSVKITTEKLLSSSLKFVTARNITIFYQALTQ
ncbi:hypothetical protein HMPREF0239_00165 [Clostridium sp. ATCC BAA-442]|nr:hypothetical protein HMPREF0239_00165 [Clostridium sp. ATCC BAA-442]